MKKNDIFKISIQLFIICITPIILSIVAMCYKFVEANELDVISRMERSVKHIYQSLDMTLARFDEAGFQLANNHLIMNYMDFYNSLEYTSLIRADAFFASFFSINSDIQDSIIIYLDENVVYSPKTGIYKIEEYYQNDYISYIRNNLSNKTLIQQRIKTIEGQANEVVTIARPVPLFSNNPKVIIIVDILSDYFEKLIRDANIDDEMNIFLINDKNELIINLLKDDTVEYEALLYDIDQHNEQDKNYFIQKSYNNIVSYSISQNNNWKCIGIVPYSVVYKGLYSLWVFVIILTFVLLVVSIFLSVALANNMYKPLAAVANFFSSMSKANKDTNIYDYIKSNVSNVLEKNKLLEDSINEFQPVIKNNFINHLLTGAIEDQKQIFQQLEHFNLELDNYPSYTVYIISFKNNKKFDSHNHKQKVLMQIYILEILNTFISLKCHGIASESGINEISVIINHPDWTYEECRQFGKEMHTFLVNNMKYSIEITIGMGNSVNDIVNIPNSRLEAMQAISFSFMVGKNKLICFEDMQNRTDCYKYPFHKEQELIANLKKCDIDCARNTLNEIIFPLNNIDVHTSYYVFIQLLCAIVRLINELGGKLDMGNEEFNIYKIMKDINIHENAQIFFNNLLQKVIMLIADRKDNKNSLIIEKIKNHIEENYRSDISLELLAEKVFLSATYLSKLFKSETGINIKEYVDKVRLEKAKKLLRNPKYSISQVGELIGYTQPQSFIKFFKRHLGSTPGEFRNTLNQNEN